MRNDENKKTTKRLLQLKDEIDAAQREYDNQCGALETHTTELKEEHGVKNVKEADAQHKKLQKKAADLSQQLDERVQELEERYEW